LRTNLMTQSAFSKTHFELQAINQMLESIGQAPVTNLNQSNPDVAIAYDTLMQVSRDVQAEGWTFNREYDYSMVRQSDGTITVPSTALQVSLTDSNAYNKDKRAVVRTQSTGSTTRKLYDIISHSFIWSQTIKCDVVWFVEFVAIPIPIQSYIVARAAKFFSQRTIGDGTQYSALAEQEVTCRAYALEYDTRQIDRYFFGYNNNGQFYNSYQPFKALTR